MSETINSLKVSRNRNNTSSLLCASVSVMQLGYNMWICQNKYKVAGSGLKATFNRSLKVLKKPISSCVVLQIT